MVHAGWRALQVVDFLPLLQVHRYILLFWEKIQHAFPFKFCFPFKDWRDTSVLILPFALR